MILSEIKNIIISIFLMFKGILLFEDQQFPEMKLSSVIISLILFVAIYMIIFILGITFISSLFYNNTI